MVWHGEPSFLQDTLHQMAAGYRRTSFCGFFRIIPDPPCSTSPSPIGQLCWPTSRSAAISDQRSLDHFGPGTRRNDVLMFHPVGLPTPLNGVDITPSSPERSPRPGIRRLCFPLPRSVPGVARSAGRRPRSEVSGSTTSCRPARTHARLTLSAGSKADSPIKLGADRGLT